MQRGGGGAVPVGGYGGGVGARAVAPVLPAVVEGGWWWGRGQGGGEGLGEGAGAGVGIVAPESPAQHEALEVAPLWAISGLACGCGVGSQLRLGVGVGVAGCLGSMRRGLWG